jgi:small ligand-binding sensory domain FIST
MRYAITLALSFRAPSHIKDEEYVVRGIPSINLSEGSITVQTDVSEGTSLWFSSRDKEKISTGLDRMARQIKEQLEGDPPKLVFHFDCASRGKMMFRDQEKFELLKRYRQSVDPEVPWAGFYAYGEIGPVEEHNDRNLYTAVTLALS